MFGSAALEVGIGLILIFLLMSLIMTAVQEALQGFFNTRARTLEASLLEILQGDGNMRDAFYNHPLIYALYRGGQTPGQGQTPPPARLPSYIPRETFAAALLDLLKGGQTPASQPLQQAVDGLQKIAGTDAAALRREVESWYDAAMDRASGAFKRRSQASLFLLGLGVAVLLNVNAIVIAQYLAVSPQQRALVTAIAERAIREQPVSTPASAPQGQAPADRPAAAPGDAAANAAVPAEPSGNAAVPAEAGSNAATPAETAGNAATPAEAAGNSMTPAEATGNGVTPSATPPLISNARVRALTDELVETGMPFGWGPASRSWIARGFPAGGLRDATFETLFAALLLIAGYLVTAFAVMLGAPFWFDVLNKIMVIRATVKPREKSQDEASEDRGGGGRPRR